MRTRATYDGRQLQPHWILRTTGIAGDALVAFRGPCRIPPEQIADLEDLLAGATIAGDDMVHFVWESFDAVDLRGAVLRQRLLAARAREILQTRTPKARHLRRDGDDLWVGDRKLSISVAARSPVSTLIHFAVNVGTDGVPVRAIGLDALGVAPVEFAREMLARTLAEETSIDMARCKVRARLDS
jgi:hypothetical protein